MVRVVDSYWDTAPSRHLLGQAYKDFAAVVGWDRAVDIGYHIWANKRPPSRRNGGKHGRVGIIYVPKMSKSIAESELARFTRESEVTKLVAAYGGGRFEFPSMEAASVSGRNRALVKRIREGQAASEVAFLFGITERQVRRICADFAQDDRDKYQD